MADAEGGQLQLQPRPQEEAQADAALDRAASPDGSVGASTIIQVTFEDMLVTDEGEWIQSHRHKLLQLWRLLKRGCARHSDLYLSGCSFAVFSSFVYRWTLTEGEDSTDSVSLASVSSHSSSVDMQTGEGEEQLVLRA